MAKEKPLEIKVEDCENCKKETTWVYMRTHLSGKRVYRCLDCKKEKMYEDKP